MHIAILTFDGFNELDSLIAFGMLSRISLREHRLADAARHVDERFDHRRAHRSGASLSG